MIKLYDYQEDSVARLNSRFKTGQNALMVMASGLGKTIVSAAWAKQHVLKGRGLFLCHENGILEQALGEYRKVLGQKAALGLFHGFHKDLEEVDVLFASLQSMQEWYQVFLSNEFHYVIVDESHHSQAPTFKEVIQYFNPKYLLGMTATPDRMDQRDIREIFGEEVVNIPLEYAIGQGWLTPIEYHLITDNLNTYTLRRLVEQATNEKKRISMRQLNETIFVQALAEKAAEIVRSYNRKAVIFCEGILHAEHFQQFFPDSRVYHSRRTPGENRITLEAFRNGDLRNILVIDKFNEGIDIPDTELIVFMRCTDSKTVFHQQLGRGLRKKEGKDKVVVLDFVANAHRVAVVQDIVREVAKNIPRPEIERNPLYISGRGFQFHFSKEQLDILEIIERMQLRYISDIPHLLAEYSEKNPWPPEEVPAGTRQKILWKCGRCQHEWSSTGTNRARGSGCPSCTNYVVTRRNNLAATHPELALEYSVENRLPANCVFAGTRESLWWICRSCQHRWQARGDHRVSGSGCPVCSGRIPSKGNNLAVTHPHLVAEYSPKNVLPADKILAGTNKFVWWICGGCGHEWRARGSSRACKGSGCPKCNKWWLKISK